MDADTPDAPGSNRGTFVVHSKIDVTGTALAAVLEYFSKYDVKDEMGTYIHVTTGHDEPQATK